MPRRESGSLVAPFTLSAILHALIATLLFASLKERKPVALPPMYRVNIVAAPPGERAIGEVKPAEAARTPVTPPTPAPSTIKEPPGPKAKTAPAKARPTATQTKAPAAKPKATTP